MVLWGFDKGGGKWEKKEEKRKRYQDIIFSFFTPKASYNNLYKYNSKLKNNVHNIESFPFVDKTFPGNKISSEKIKKSLSDCLVGRCER